MRSSQITTTSETDGRVPQAGSSHAQPDTAGRPPRVRMSAFAMAADILHDYRTTRGRFGLFKLVVKSLLLLRRFRAHRHWCSVVNRPTTRGVLAVMPRLAYRHSSAYLFADLRWGGRIGLLTAHYAFVNRHMTPACFAAAIDGGVPLWCAPDGRPFEIRLHGPPAYRGGDLELHFSSDGNLLCRLAFSIAPTAFFDTHAAPGLAHLIYIGEVQGTSGCFDAIRDATKRCGDITPADLLMSALAGLALASGIERLMSAGAGRHLSAHKLAATSHPFDYAGFWSRYHASETPGGHYVMALPYTQKPIGDIVHRHRKRTLAKRRYKAAVVDAVRTRCATTAGSAHV